MQEQNIIWRKDLVAVDEDGNCNELSNSKPGNVAHMCMDISASPHDPKRPLCKWGFLSERCKTLLQCSLRSCNSFQGLLKMPASCTRRARNQFEELKTTSQSVICKRSCRYMAESEVIA